MYNTSFINQFKVEKSYLKNIYILGTRYEEDEKYPKIFTNSTADGKMSTS